MSQPFSVSPLAFWLLAALALGAAVAVVASRNLFHAGVALFGSLLGVAGLYVTLQAHFLAGVQVLVYAGAIAVILLFAIMLTHRLMDPARGTLTTQPWAGLGAALLVGITTATVILNTSWSTDPDGARGAGMDPAEVTRIARLGRSLLDPYVLPFELITVVVLAAMIGAIAVARPLEEEPVREERP